MSEAQKDRFPWKGSAWLSILQTRKPEAATDKRLDILFKGQVDSFV